jgi:hypothetical protein
VTEPDLLAELLRFGAPIFVPSGRWRVAAIEESNGEPDGVLVFGDEGEVEVHTDSLARPRQPISIQVGNVQRATVNTPEAWSTFQNVIVEETSCEIWIADELRPLRVLQSYNSFSFEFVAGDRVVSVGGRLARLAALRIERLDDLTLTNPSPVSDL